MSTTKSSCQQSIHWPQVLCIVIADFHHTKKLMFDQAVAVHLPTCHSCAVAQSHSSADTEQNPPSQCVLLSSSPACSHVSTSVRMRCLQNTCVHRDSHFGHTNCTPPHAAAIRHFKHASKPLPQATPKIPCFMITYSQCIAHSCSM